jgi:toxin ParE1/3/4
MSRGYELSEPAQHDLDEILGYYFVEGGPSTVRTVIAHFQDAFGRLAAFPHIGRPAEHIAPAACRVWRVLDFLVVYKPDAVPLEIVRIIHGARDTDVLLTEQ